MTWFIAPGSAKASAHAAIESANATTSSVARAGPQELGGGAAQGQHPVVPVALGHVADQMADVPVGAWDGPPQLAGERSQPGLELLARQPEPLDRRAVAVDHGYQHD